MKEIFFGKMNGKKQALYDATIDYCYIVFAGFTTKDDCNSNANSDYVYLTIRVRLWYNTYVIMHICDKI